MNISTLHAHKVFHFQEHVFGLLQEHKLRNGKRTFLTILNGVWIRFLCLAFQFQKIKFDFRFLSLWNACIVGFRVGYRQCDI
jgi:hypothetical protein